MCVTSTRWSSFFLSRLNKPILSKFPLISIQTILTEKNHYKQKPANKQNSPALRFIPGANFAES